MKLEYGNIKDVKVGDIVEMVGDWARFGQPKGKLSVVVSVEREIIHIKDSRVGCSRYPKGHFKLLKTSPASEIKTGDSVIFIAEDVGKCKYMKVYEGIRLSGNKRHIYWDKNTRMSRYLKEFRKIHTLDCIGDMKKVESEKVSKEIKTKGNEMKSTKIEIKVNGKEIDLCKEATQKVPKTDLETADKRICVWFNAQGEEVHTTNDSAKMADVKLQSPEMLGYTYIIYKRVGGKTTAIPLKKV